MNNKLPINNFSTRLTLIERLQNSGNDFDWQKFVNFYSPYLYTIIRNMGINHHDAGELSQIVFIKIFSKIEDFNYSPSKGRFRHWLCAITKNTTYDLIRKKGQINRINIALSEETEISKQAKEQDYELQKSINLEWKNYLANQALIAARQHFKEHMITIFTMHVRGQSMSEIATYLNIAENTAYVYCKKVRDYIKSEIATLESEWG